MNLPDIDPDELIARADALMEEVRRTADRRSRRAFRRDQHDALEAYRFAAELLSARGRAEDIARVAALREKVRGWELGEDTMRQLMSRAIGTMIERLTGDSQDLRDLARSPRAHDRVLVAKHASLETPGCAALVHGLLADADAAVRSAAAARLPNAVPPWWAGAFSTDPLLHVDPSTHADVEPALRAIAEGWDGVVEDFDALVPALDRLPSVLLFDTLERAFALRVAHNGDVAPVLSLVLERAGGAEALLAIVGRADERRWYGFHRAGPLLARGTPELRAARALELADRLLAIDDDDDLTLSAAELCQRIAREWPVEIDPSPLVERALARPDAIHRSALVGGVPRAGALALVWAEGLLEERARGGRGPLSDLFAFAADELVKATPVEVVRPYAERALAERHPWGVTELLGRCHDPSTDPPLDVLALAWVEEPRLRAAVLAAVPKRLTGWLRERLLRGELSLDEATTLLERGGPRLRAAEWAKIRELRAVAVEDRDGRAFDVIAAFPRGKWTAADWADFDRFIEQWPSLALFLEDGLVKQTAPEAIPHLERLLAVTSASRAGRKLLAYRTALAARHGVELGPPVLRPGNDDDDDEAYDDD